MNIPPEAVEILAWTAFTIALFGFPIALGWIGGTFDPILRRLGMKTWSLIDRDDPRKQP